MSDQTPDPKSNLRPWIDPDLEARIVALVLGEASDFEREELERLIAEDSDLAAYRNRIESVHGLMDAVANQDIASTASAGMELPAAMRDDLIAVFEGTSTSLAGQKADAADTEFAVDSASPDLADENISAFRISPRLRNAIAIAALVVGMALVGTVMMPNASYQRHAKSEPAVPMLGDIPIVGRVFRGEDGLDEVSGYQHRNHDFSNVGYTNFETAEASSGEPSTLDAGQRARRALALLDSDSTDSYAMVGGGGYGGGGIDGRELQNSPITGGIILATKLPDDYRRFERSAQKADTERDGAYDRPQESPVAPTRLARLSESKHTENGAIDTNAEPEPVEMEGFINYQKPVKADPNHPANSLVTESGRGNKKSGELSNDFDEELGKSSLLAMVDEQPVPAFQREFLGGANELHGFRYREVAPDPAKPVAPSAPPVPEPIAPTIAKQSAATTIDGEENTEGRKLPAAKAPQPQAAPAIARFDDDRKRNELALIDEKAQRNAKPAIKLDYGVPVEGTSENGSSGRSNFSSGYEFGDTAAPEPDAAVKAPVNMDDGWASQPGAIQSSNGKLFAGQQLGGDGEREAASEKEISNLTTKLGTLHDEAKQLKADGVVITGNANSGSTRSSGEPDQKSRTTLSAEDGEQFRQSMIAGDLIAKRVDGLGINSAAPASGGASGDIAVDPFAETSSLSVGGGFSEVVAPKDQASLDPDSNGPIAVAGIVHRVPSLTSVVPVDGGTKAGVITGSGGAPAMVSSTGIVDSNRGGQRGVLLVTDGSISMEDGAAGQINPGEEIRGKDAVPTPANESRRTSRVDSDGDRLDSLDLAKNLNGRDEWKKETAKLQQNRPSEIFERLEIANNQRTEDQVIRRELDDMEKVSDESQLAIPENEKSATEWAGVETGVARATNKKNQSGAIGSPSDDTEVAVKGRKLQPDVQLSDSVPQSLSFFGRPSREDDSNQGVPDDSISNEIARLGVAKQKLAEHKLEEMTELSLGDAQKEIDGTIRTEALANRTPSIQVTTKFVEVEQSNTDELGYDWLLKQTDSDKPSDHFTEEDESGGRIAESRELAETARGPKLRDFGSMTYTPLSQDQPLPGTDSFFDDVVQFGDEAEEESRYANPALTSGLRSGGFAVDDDSIDGLIAAQQTRPAISFGFGGEIDFIDQQYEQVVDPFNRPPTDSFWLADSDTVEGNELTVNPRADSTNRWYSNVKSGVADTGKSPRISVVREFIALTEIDPPEIPPLVGNLATVNSSVAADFPITPANPYDSEFLTEFQRSAEQPELRFTQIRKQKQKLEAPEGLAETTTSDEPFSTFSLHVSDVSFQLARTSLDKGEWPDTERIRVEEFVNALDYGDPLPSLNDKVACQMEQTIHPFLQQRNLLRLSMRTAAAGRSQATPLSLTLVLDHSGSMERHDRQQTVQRAFAQLADQLTETDTATVIGFARQPRLLADRISGAAREQLLGTITDTPSEGGTHLESALDLAFEKAREQAGENENAQSRVILLTDGAANLGDADPERLGKKVIQMREAGIAFDAAGIGADGLNDEILEALTRQGDGRYYLLDQPEDADEGFARQIAGALRPAAMNVKVQIEFNPDRVASYKLLGFEKHRLKKEDFRNDKVDAAEIAAEEAGVAVYQFEPIADGEGDVGTAFLRFRDMSSGQMVEKRWPIAYAPDAPRPQQASPKVRLATVAALFAAKLKGDALGESVDLGELRQLVDSLPPHQRDLERVQQLRTMIDQASNLDR